MAKGNLLLGTAGNSVGDVVMYRREGAQVSRVRVRKIKNPKTDAQSLQRAAFSPVAKFYSPLAVVLERSFEGLSKMKSYNKFLKTNIDLARANGWLLPKGTGFFPLPYKLSNGTLPVVDYQASQGAPGIMVNGTGEQSIGSETIGALSQQFVAAGYQNGDIVTIIYITSDAGAEPKNCVPYVAQFEIDTTSTAVTVEAIPNFQFSAAEGSLTISHNGNFAGGAVIVARYENDKWRRSSQFLLVKASILDYISAADYKAAAIASYGMNAGDPNPLVYLDGDTLEG